MSSPHPLLATVATLLQQTPTPWAIVLERVLAQFDCVVGTIHLLDPKDGVLHLEAQRGLPPPVLEKVQLVPIGKGMAGLAAERREPVQVCNLQSDTSGKAMARQHEATVAHLFGTLTATERKAMHTLLGSVKQHLRLERTA